MFNNELNQELTRFEHHVFETLGHLKRRMHDMSLDLKAITDAQARVSADVTKLIDFAKAAVASSDPGLQPQLDELAKNLNDSAAAVEAILPSAAPATA